MIIIRSLKINRENIPELNYFMSVSNVQKFFECKKFKTSKIVCYK